MPPNSTGTWLWHILKGISFSGTVSDVIQNFYEKCKSRFHFFLLRRPVKVGGLDKDLNSARRLKQFKNVISQSCAYKMDARRDRSLPPHTPFAEPGFTRSWAARDLKLSLLTTAWKFKSLLLVKARSNLLETRQPDGRADILLQRPSRLACVLIQVEATWSAEEDELGRYQRADPGSRLAALSLRIWTDAPLRLQSSTHRAQQRWRWF